jgi:tRNA(fMet)-specific endonuclease VapC
MILDTTVCVDLLRERAQGIQGAAYHALDALGDSRLYLSVYSVCELNTGALLSSNKPVEQRRVADFVQHLTVLYPDIAFPTVYSEAAAALLTAGTPIPVMDLLIGITAKTNGLPLLTRDRKHFHRIPGLVVEWYGPDDQ